MSFLSKISKTLEENKILAKKIPAAKNDRAKSDLADKLDIARAQLVDALGRELDPTSPRFRSILNKWRAHWYDTYDFALRPDQEKRYLEVLKQRSE